MSSFSCKYKSLIGSSLITLSSLAIAAPDFGPVDMQAFYTSLPTNTTNQKLGVSN